MKEAGQNSFCWFSGRKTGTDADNAEVGVDEKPYFTEGQEEIKYVYLKML